MGGLPRRGRGRIAGDVKGKPPSSRRPQSVWWRVEVRGLAAWRPGGGAAMARRCTLQPSTGRSTYHSLHVVLVLSRKYGVGAKIRSHPRVDSPCSRISGKECVLCGNPPPFPPGSGRGAGRGVKPDSIRFYGGQTAGKKVVAFPAIGEEVCRPPRRDAPRFEASQVNPDKGGAGWHGVARLTPTAGGEIPGDPSWSEPSPSCGRSSRFYRGLTAEAEEKIGGNDENEPCCGSGRVRSAVCRGRRIALPLACGKACGLPACHHT